MAQSFFVYRRIKTRADRRADIRYSRVISGGVGAGESGHIGREIQRLRLARSERPTDGGRYLYFVVRANTPTGCRRYAIRIVAACDGIAGAKFDSLA